MSKRIDKNVIDIHTGRPLYESIEAAAPKKPAKAAKAIKAAKGAKGAKKALSPEEAARAAHKWEFKARFRKNGFGWRSQPAVAAIKAALGEIKKAAKTDPVLAAEGSVLFLEKVSPALMQVDSSSGALGGTLNAAIKELAQIIAGTSVDEPTREEWLERLWRACEEDEMPYLEAIGNNWGDFCASATVASKWADRLIDDVRDSWSDKETYRFSDGASACLSALIKAERYDELFALLDLDKSRSQIYHEFGALALARMGKVNEAVDYMQAHSHNCAVDWVAAKCEKFLLDAGRVDEAFEKYAFDANRQASYLNTYRAVAKKYPDIPPERKLAALIKCTPGEESKWFATAKELKQFELAAHLAEDGPCEPKTLTRAAIDYRASNTVFALRVGLASLYWLLRDYGYEISAVDVKANYDATIAAAKILGKDLAVKDLLKKAVVERLPQRGWATQILAGELGIATR